MSVSISLTPKQRLHYWRSVLAYSLRVGYRTFSGGAWAFGKPLAVQDQPLVSIFISSLNTKEPLQLTLNTLKRYTRYQNYKIVIGENASTDGSVEYLHSLPDTNIEIEQHDAPQQHSAWLDWMFRNAETKYWFAVDSDMLFLASDWLMDMVVFLEENPQVGILSGEAKPGYRNFVEPVGKTLVDGAECPSTWLMAVRTEVREKVRTSFAFVKEEISAGTGNLQICDTGGKLLRDVQAVGWKYAIMPAEFRRKWYHFGSLSWSKHFQSNPGYAAYKKYQLSDIRRRLARP